jgi:hypothetical protein
MLTMIDTLNTHDSDLPTGVNSVGDKYWKNSEGKLHRDGDKPAMVRADGTKEWWVNGIFQHKETTSASTPGHTVVHINPDLFCEYMAKVFTHPAVK